MNKSKIEKSVPKVINHIVLGNDKVIIFSHGFGVKWDARGMFTEIFSNLEGWDCIYFDYCDTDEQNNTYVFGIDKQKICFENAIAKLQLGKYKRVVVISHSFGIVVPSLIDSKLVTDFIAIAPPPFVSKEKQLEMLMAKPGGKIDLKGYSERPRSDGSTTYIHYSFYDSLQNLDIPKLFSSCNAKNKGIIKAKDDEIVDPDYSAFIKDPEIKFIEILGNHNLEGNYRPLLLETIKGLLE